MFPNNGISLLELYYYANNNNNLYFTQIQKIYKIQVEKYYILHVDINVLMFYSFIPKSPGQTRMRVVESSNSHSRLA